MQNTSTSALIPITHQIIAGHQTETINARELHVFLEAGRDFSTWIKGRIAEYDFKEDYDYIYVHQNGGTQDIDIEEKQTPFKKRIDYFLTISMSKELCMVERNEKGRQARLYFIECERRLKEVQEARAAEAMAHIKEGGPATISLSVFNACRKIGLTTNISRLIAMEATHDMTGNYASESLPAIDDSLYRLPNLPKMILKKLREFRTARGISQSKMSQDLFGDMITYGDMERGSRPMTETDLDRALVAMGANPAQVKRMIYQTRDLTIPGSVFGYVRGLREYLALMGQAAEVDEMAENVSSEYQNERNGAMTLDVGKICGAVIFDMCTIERTNQ